MLGSLRLSLRPMRGRGLFSGMIRVGEGEGWVSESLDKSVQDKAWVRGSEMDGLFRLRCRSGVGHEGEQEIRPGRYASFEQETWCPL